MLHFKFKRWTHPVKEKSTLSPITVSLSSSCYWSRIIKTSGENLPCNPLVPKEILSKFIFSGKLGIEIWKKTSWEILLRSNYITILALFLGLVYPETLLFPQNHRQNLETCNNKHAFLQNRQRRWEGRRKQKRKREEKKRKKKKSTQSRLH